MLLILTGTVLDSNIPIDKKKYENENCAHEQYPVFIFFNKSTKFSK